MTYILSLFPSIDVFVLGLFCLLLILHLIFINKSRLFADVIAAYTAFFLVVLAPLLYPPAAVWLSSHPLARVAAFLVVAGLLHIVFWHSNIKGFSREVRPFAFVTSVAYRIAIVGLLVSTVVYFLPSPLHAFLGPLSTFLFGTIWALLAWFFVPLVLAFVYHYHTKNGWM